MDINGNKQIIKLFVLRAKLIDGRFGEFSV